MRLLVGNEDVGNRPWLGEICLAAVYDTALTSAEVGQNFQAGCPTAATPPAGGGGGTPSGVVYTYDNRGNRLSAGSEVFTYDDRNRLTSDGDFESVRGSRAVRNITTGKIWELDMLHRDHYKVYKNKKQWENGNLHVMSGLTGDRRVVSDG